jgi:mitochondrial fission protein ELM1
VVTDGKAGMESQCLGLAEALGLEPVVKRVSLRTPWRQFTPYLRWGGRLQFTRGSDSLAAPWPNLLIATGRHSVAASILVRRANAEGIPPTRTVQIQDPVVDPVLFDLVIAPRHDGLGGRNIVTTMGALHRITPEKLRAGAARLAPRIAALSPPFISVLIGGSNGAYRFGPAEMTPLAARLRDAARAMGASLLITPSRRTDAQSLRILRDALAELPHFLWDGTGENPYFGLLGIADFIVVTCDSVNMVTEAASTGKPVYVVVLPGGGEKSHRFHRLMRDEGYTKAFAGPMTPYAYQPLDEMGAVVARVRTLLRG